MGAGFVDHLNGMYAFAIWDLRSEELLLVRDRMGVKPLYYYPTSDGVLFGSEPKAILAHPYVDAVVDADGLCEIFSIGKTPEHAVFRGMYEVRPGSMVRISREGLTKVQCWQLEARENTDDLGTTVLTVRALLEDIVARQLFADVPVGTLLSGGLDSSPLRSPGTSEPSTSTSCSTTRTFWIRWCAGPHSVRRICRSPPETWSTRSIRYAVRCVSA